jgi:glycosyltransferase involved in cell wall biosynthesis
MDVDNDDDQHRPIKILQIGKYYPPDEGGVETVTRDLAEGLLYHGIQADILCFSRQNTYPPTSDSIKVHRARTDFRIGNKSISMDYIRLLRSLEPSYDAAILHLPNPIGMFAANWFWKKPLALLWHSDIVTYPRIRQMIRGAECQVIQKSSTVFAPTPAHIEGSYLASALRAKAVIGPFPFTPDRLKVATIIGKGIKREIDFLAGRKLILAVGRLVPYKGFDVLINAARSLTNSAAICIAGSGPLHSELQSRINSQGVQDRVLLSGRVEDVDLGTLYERAHLVTMPSITRAEMYGMTQVEAMSYGKPVVSTDIPNSGVSWVNKHEISGLIVPVGNESALADALNRLANNNIDYERLSRGARMIFAREHSLVAAASVYAAALRSILAGHSAGVL